MKNSLYPFLSGIIDYAGLYPPASLSLQNSFKKYTDHTTSEQSWMLSKFVVGTNLLQELSGFINNSDKSPDPFLITLVGAPSDDLASFKTVISNLAEQVLDVIHSSEKKITISTLEIKMPVNIDYSIDSTELQEAMRFSVDQMNTDSGLPHQIFFEIPGFDFKPERVKSLTGAICSHNNLLEERSLENYSFSGFKIRCGGVEAFQFPPVGYLAYAISEAAKCNTPVKFTAGLHHPVRHYNETVSTKMHGFLNVFGAALLYYSKGLDETELAEILSDENPKNFSFSETEFRWKGHSVQKEEIHMLRTLSVTSFGSCSFDEPVEDLQELNLI